MGLINMQPTISKILFNSLIFALGISPTLAMWVMELRQIEFHTMIFMSLCLTFAVLIVPIILLQNAYLLYKRQDEMLGVKLNWLARLYLVLNGICLVSWILFMMK